MAQKKYTAFCTVCYSGARLETNSKKAAGVHCTGHERAYPGHAMSIIENKPAVPLPVDIAWIDDNDGCGPRKLQNSVRCF